MHTADSLKLKAKLLQRLLPLPLLHQQSSIVKDAAERVRVLVPQRAPIRSQRLKVQRLGLIQIALATQQIGRLLMESSV